MWEASSMSGVSARITGEGRRSNVGADEWEDCRG